MSTILQHTPGSQVTIILQTLTADGIREDGYSIPVVSRVILPDLSESTLYPLDMTKISTGLYYHRFLLPSGAVAIGSYLVDLSWTDIDDNEKEDLVQVVCTATAGNFSVSPT